MPKLTTTSSQVSRDTVTTGKPALEQASTCKPPSLLAQQPPFDPALLPLAGYAHKRAMQNRPLDPRTLEKLKLYDGVTRQTRQELLSRGNVKQDIAASHGESTRRQVAARTLVLREIPKERLDTYGGDDERKICAIAKQAAAATFMQAGNCAEFSAVQTTQLAAVLQPGDQVHRVSDFDQTHSWTEVSCEPPLPEGRILVDAWLDGPTVLREDAEFGKKMRLTDFSLPPSQQLQERANKALADLKEGAKTPEQYLAQVPADFKPPANMVFDSEAVLSAAMLAPLAPPATKGLPNNVVEEAVAAGVARKLGASVKQASIAAPAIVLASTNLDTRS